MNGVLVMGCEGRVDNGFVFCSSVQNIILDFSDIQHTANYKQLIEYLDTVSKIFEGPIFNGNVMMNTIHKIWELGYVSEELYKRTIDLYNWHKRCGIFLRLDPK